MNLAQIALVDNAQVGSARQVPIRRPVGVGVAHGDQNVGVGDDATGQIDRSLLDRIITVAQTRRVEPAHGHGRRGSPNFRKTPATQSRVVPGRSATMLSDRPSIRLASVDLAHVGPATTTTVGGSEQLVELRMHAFRGPSLSPEAGLSGEQVDRGGTGGHKR